MQKQVKKISGRKIIKFAGLKSEAETWQLGQSICLKLCKLVDKLNKGEGTDVYAVNTQDQWEVKRVQLGADSSSVHQGKSHILSHRVLYDLLLVILS